MVQLRRRGFLQGAVALAALAVTVREAFGSAPTIDRRALLKVAWQGAAAAGLPMLVLIVPEHGDYFRAQALGAWLNHGDDSLMALLGGFVVVCATAAELRAQFSGPPVTDDTWMVVVHTTGAEVGTIPVIVPLNWFEKDAPEMRSRIESEYIEPRDTGEPPDGWEELEQARGEARNVLITRCLLDALPPALRAPTSPEEAARRAALAVQTLREAPPPGVYWAQASGCSPLIENLDWEYQKVFGCGMGRVSAWDRRYLHWNQGDNL